MVSVVVIYMCTVPCLAAILESPPCSSKGGKRCERLLVGNAEDFCDSPCGFCVKQIVRARDMQLESFRKFQYGKVAVLTRRVLYHGFYIRRMRVNDEIAVLRKLLCQFHKCRYDVFHVTVIIQMVGVNVRNHQNTRRQVEE